MARDVLADLRLEISRASRARLSFTERAFRALPRLKRPRILDVGCGIGGPTLELARLSDGKIVALDIDAAALDELSRKVDEAGQSERITVLNRSMLAMDFDEVSFDVIWSEGSVIVIGFAAALSDWRRFIKPDGFLVIHEMIWIRPDPPEEIADQWRRIFPGLRTASHHIEEIRPCGYELIESFPLPEDTWWTDYYGPLEARIAGLRDKRSTDERLERVLAAQEQ